MYHSISEESSPLFAKYCLSARKFAAHLAYLADNGWHSLTAGALAATLTSGAPLPDKTVVLTFDDGYDDFHTVALPLLQRYGFAASLFVPTAYVGTTSRWLRSCQEENRRILTWSALWEVSSAGVEIGAHSHTHPQLDRIPDAAVRQEARSAKTILEDGLAERVTGFAYPFGYWNRANRRALKATGYDWACSVDERPAGHVDALLSLPRLTVSGNTTVAELQALLATGTGPGQRTLSGVKRGLWHAARAARPAWGGDPLEGAHALAGAPS
jgi:peptidoglycan/xylan/chitin deacetylase (PgdA/CDA1 family)